MRFALIDAGFLPSATRQWLLRCSFWRQDRDLRRLFILGVEGGRPEYVSSFPYRRCRGSTQQTILPCPPLPPPHTKQSSSWVVQLQETPRTLSMRHRRVPKQKHHVRTASARRTRRVRGAPTVAVASPNRRIWGFWRGGGGEGDARPRRQMPSESALILFFIRGSSSTGLLYAGLTWRQPSSILPTRTATTWVNTCGKRADFQLRCPGNRDSDTDHLMRSTASFNAILR